MATFFKSRRRYTYSDHFMANNMKTPENSARFPTTSWTMIVNTRDPDVKVSRKALEKRAVVIGLRFSPSFAAGDSTTIRHATAPNLSLLYYLKRTTWRMLSGPRETSGRFCW